MVDVDVHVLSHLKELAWGADNAWVISNNSYSTKDLKESKK